MKNAILAVDADTGRLTESTDLQVVDHLLKLRKEKPFWEVVEAVVDAWVKRDPEQYKSYVIHLDAVKKDQKVKSKGGGRGWRGVSKTDGIERSLVVDYPVWIDMCLRVLYKGDEVEFDKKFYREIAKRFPMFRIREKV